MMNLFPRISGVKHIEDFALELTFTDGFKARMDFRKKIIGRGGVFEPLENVEFFRRVAVDPEAGTIFWPNGVDLCPDALYSEATGKPLPSFESASANNAA
jgi:hypothetical protein